MPFDANKLYCSEVLAILLQDNDGELPPIEPGPGWDSCSDPPSW